MLELGGDSPATWRGTITIAAGALRLQTAAGLGGTTHTGGLAITNPSAALQLSGTATVYNAYPFTLSNTGIDNGGALENVSGNNLWTGPIIYSQTVNTTIGASGGTLRLSGGISAPALATGTLFLAGAGNITLLTAPLAATVGPITTIGSGTTTLGVSSTAYVSALTVSSGTLAVSEAGKLGTGSILLNPGSTLTVNDTGLPSNNRLGTRTVTISGGSLNLIGSGSGATLETITPTFNRGASTITVTAGVGRQATLLLNGAINNVAPAQSSTPSAASVLFRATNLGQPLVGTAGSGASMTHPPLPNVAGIAVSNGINTIATLIGAGLKDTPTKGMLPWALVDTDVVNGVGTSFATFDSATNPLDTAPVPVPVPGFNPIRALRPTEQTSILTPGANLSLNTVLPLVGTAADTTFNSLTLTSAGGGLTMTGLTGLSLSSGGVLALPGNGGSPAASSVRRGAARR